MGWTWTHKPKGTTATQFLIEDSGSLSWSGESKCEYKVLDTAIVNLKTFYAAVERIDKETGKRDVWAAVFLLGFAPKSKYENFGWKSMDESMGPNEARCPERILDLLTPTEHPYAIKWREACRKFHADRKMRPKIEVGGTVVLYGKSYKVTNSRGGKGFFVKGVVDGQTYRLSHMKSRQCTQILPPPKLGDSPQPAA